MKLALLLAAVAAAGPMSPPKGWIEVAPPATPEQWQCANYSLPDRAVSGAATAPLRIAEQPSQAQPDRRLALADGTLFGSNHGEFGGKIEWLPTGGSKRTLVIEANTLELLARGQEVFAITGLAHLSTDEGKLLRLRREKNGWTATEVLDLGAAPFASYRIDPDRLLIASGKGVALVDLSKLTIRSLHDNPGWMGVYPNSIRPFGDAIALGARGAVIVLRHDGKGYDEHWWVPRECRQTGKACPCSSMPEYLQ